MQEDSEPRVGIFWLYNGKLIIDSTPVSEGQPYGDNLGHATGHIHYWTALQERGVVPVHVEYEEPPRGRVGFNKKTKQSFMLADSCIINNAGAVKKIIVALHLPVDTEPMPDSHYRCAKCLRRNRHGEDQ